MQEQAPIRRNRAREKLRQEPEHWQSQTSPNRWQTLHRMVAARLVLAQEILGVKLACLMAARGRINPRFAVLELAQALEYHLQTARWSQQARQHHAWQDVRQDWSSVPQRQGRWLGFLLQFQRLLGLLPSAVFS